MLIFSLLKMGFLFITLMISNIIILIVNIQKLVKLEKSESCLKSQNLSLLLIDYEEKLYYYDFTITKILRGRISLINWFLVRKFNKWTQSIQEWSSKICKRQPLKNLKWYSLLKNTVEAYFCCFHTLF